MDRDVWIPAAHDVRLAARVWMPDDATYDPVPGILELLPYRKSDGTAVRDSQNASWFAKHGYAVVRVDLRGTGNSEGIISDEYTHQELADGVTCLDWIAHQPWCTGRVGMMGISWGGFNALQVAALTPHNLHAVIALCATDDRYADDVHYWGGALLADQQLPWATTMLAHNACPPEPEIYGDQWLSMWQNRLAKTPPFIKTWMEHQRRDEFWQHGSVCEHPGDIRCPVLLASGWADAYKDAVFRLLDSLSVPRRAIVGPWSHAWPNMAAPGPRIGFLHEALRWWDRWLKDTPNGADEQPMLRAWLQDPITPAAFYHQRPGRWVSEPSWPTRSVAPLTLHLGAGTASFDSILSPPPPLSVPCVQSHGGHSGRSVSYGHAFDQAIDQRSDDALATCLTTEPLPARLDLLGIPQAHLEISADRPNALVTIRLCDIAPDGTSLLLSRGALNLTHRNSHQHPEPVIPGEHHTATFPLHALGHSIPAGHRLRVAIAATDWPMIWPSPHPVQLTIYPSGSRLDLPARTAPHTEPQVTFAPPESPAPFDHTPLDRHETGTISRDLATGRVTTTYQDEGGYTREELGKPMRYRTHSRDTFDITDTDPTSARVRSRRRIDISRGDWHTHVDATGQLTCDADTFYVTSGIIACQDHVQVFHREWAFSVPRDLT